jgi:hypothetical protein
MLHGIDPDRQRHIAANLEAWAGGDDVAFWIERPDAVIVADAARHSGAPWMMGPVDQITLAALALRAKYSRSLNGKVLEVGRFCGASTAVWCLATLQVTSLDIGLTFEQWREWSGEDASGLGKLFPGAKNLTDCASMTLQRMGLTAELLTGDSTKPESWPHHFSKFGLVFIDGGHDEETSWNDLSRGWRHVQLGGWLVAHDYNLAAWGTGVNAGSGVDIAWDRLVTDVGGLIEGPFTTPGSSLVWVRRKKGA